MTTASKEWTAGYDRPNWLLHGLIGVSFVLHATALIWMPVAHHQTRATLIELTLEENTPPAPLAQPPPPEPEKKRDELQRAIVKPTHTKKPVVQPKPLPSEESIKPVISEAQPVFTPPPEVVDMPEREVSAEQIVNDDVAMTPSAPTSVIEARPNDDGKSIRNYFALIRQRIEKCKRYPLSARMKHLEGQVTIGFVLTNGGEPQQLTVIKSAGQEILDQAALSAVRDASPLPPPPAALLSEKKNMEITIVFTLARGRFGG